MNLNGKSFLHLYIAMLAVIVMDSINAQGTSDAEKASRFQKPNIIFILTDDLGYGDLGVLFQNRIAESNTTGAPRQFTPNLDQMAAEGALLPHHYSAAPVCAPSRASFLTGRSQGHATVRDNQFDKALDDNLTLASVLRQAGYATAAIGKWGLQGRSGNAPNWTAHPLNRGFDYFLGYMRHRDGHEHYPKEGLYRGSKEVYENRTDISTDLDKCYTADLWTAAAKRWIVNQRNGSQANKPFFMFLAYDTPHAVLELPTQAYPEGGGLNGGLQWTGRPGEMINTASGEVDSWVHPNYANAEYDDDDNSATAQQPWPEVYQRYATDTRRIDSAVGDLIQLLKDLEIDDNTLVVFTSDNGPSRESYLEGQENRPTFFKSFGPFDGIKRDVWEGGVRMPTIARWPGTIPSGRTIETPSISYDWMPTFTEMAGLPVPALSDGVSLVPSLLDQGKQPASHIYVEYFQGGATPTYDDFLPEHQGRRRNQMQLLRIGDTVGVRYDIRSHDDDFEIFDVVTDPQQKNNLADSPVIDAFQQHLKDRALRSRMPNAMATRPYDNIPVPAIEVERLENGLTWKWYDGDFPWVPEMQAVDVTKKGMAKSPNTDFGLGRDPGAAFFEGFVRIPEEGMYTFYFTANGSGLLRIHNSTVIDADQGYFSNSTKNGSIELEAGLHPIRLYYVKGANKKSDIELKWSGPGLTQSVVPDSAFFHKPD